MDLIFSFQKNELGFPVYVIYEKKKYEIEYNEKLDWQQILNEDLTVETNHKAMSFHPDPDRLHSTIIKEETLKWIKRWNRPDEKRKDFPRRSFIYSLDGLNGLPLKVLIGNRWHQIEYYEIMPVLMRDQLKVAHMYRGLRVYPQVNYRCLVDIVRYIRTWIHSLTVIKEGKIDK